MCKTKLKQYSKSYDVGKIIEETSADNNRDKQKLNKSET